ncbi:MAG: sugar phosphate isomerase/epimerase [Cyclobacteriaceae bacterium]|nr:sugar phosphate isomerase/epimerase [Cyclobacteriaceae bacterium]
MKRRDFIQKSSLAAGVAVLGNQAIGTTARGAEIKTDTSKVSAKGKIKLGLYTITYLGIWYDGPALTFDEIIQKAREFGYDGIELDNKRPLGNPMDIDQKKRENWRNLLEKNGLEIPCVAANNDFSSPIPEHRECQLLMVRETARLARDLGSPIVRLFAAWPGVPIHKGVGTYDLIRGEYYDFQRQFPYTTWIERWNYVKEELKEAAAFGEEFGVVMALQNHEPLFRHWKDCYDMVKEVNSPWLKVCLDAPIMTRHDKEWVGNAVRTVGDLQIHSHYGGEYMRNEQGQAVPKVYEAKFGKDLPDYENYIQLMNEIGYEGYFTFELCHPVLNDNHEYGKLDYVDEQVKLAAEFLKNIIKRNESL